MYKPSRTKWNTSARTLSSKLNEQLALQQLEMWGKSSCVSAKWLNEVKVNKTRAEKGLSFTDAVTRMERNVNMGQCKSKRRRKGMELIRISAWTRKDFGPVLLWLLIVLLNYKGSRKGLGWCCRKTQRKKKSLKATFCCHRSVKSVLSLQVPKDTTWVDVLKKFRLLDGRVLSPTRTTEGST